VTEVVPIPVAPAAAGSERVSGPSPPRSPSGAARRAPSRVRQLELRWGKALASALFLAPAAWLAWRAATGDLGAEPIETLSQQTGDWTLRFLLVTLAVTPARRYLGWNRLLRYRRMAGLFTFAYACLHLTCFVALDQFFDPASIAQEIFERRWITIGMVTWLLLVPLAVTSTDAAVRRLGARRWRRLHRLVYLAGLGGVLHYFWAVKADTRLPLLYAGVLLLLLASRAVPRRSRRVPPPKPRALPEGP
jgi:sulfoxide reductase heme-binding subunit YedZ